MHDHQSIIHLCLQHNALSSIIIQYLMGQFHDFLKGFLKCFYILILLNEITFTFLPQIIISCIGPDSNQINISGQNKDICKQYQL